MNRHLPSPWLRTEVVDRASLEAAAVENLAENPTTLEKLIQSRLGYLDDDDLDNASDAGGDAASAASMEQETLFPLFFGTSLVQIVDDEAVAMKGRQGRRDEAWEIEPETEARLQREFETVAVTGADVLRTSNDPWSQIWAKKVIVVPLKVAAKKRPRLRRRSRLLKRKRLAKKKKQAQTPKETLKS